MQPTAQQAAEILSIRIRVCLQAYRNSTKNGPASAAEARWHNCKRLLPQPRKPSVEVATVRAPAGRKMSFHADSRARQSFNGTIACPPRQKVATCCSPPSGPFTSITGP